MLVVNMSSCRDRIARMMGNKPELQLGFKVMLAGRAHVRVLKYCGKRDSVKMSSVKRSIDRRWRINSVSSKSCALVQSPREVVLPL